MWQARFYQSLPRIVADYPDARWMFLTLTVRNCAIGELGETLNRMNAGFQRLKDRKEFSPVQGWIRTTEVTRGSDGSAHPHFHTLMMVPPSMLSGRDYIKHERWVDLWRGCLRVDYDPNVDVRAVKPRKPKDGESLACATAELVRGAVAETLKYSTKPADMVADPEWFLELTRQTHKRRFVATGGALKDVLKLDQETDADMVIGDDISRATMTVPASRLSGKLRSESTVAHRRKIKPNQSNGVSGLRPDHEDFGHPSPWWRCTKVTSCPIDFTPMQDRATAAK